MTGVQTCALPIYALHTRIAELVQVDCEGDHTAWISLADVADPPDTDDLSSAAACHQSAGSLDNLAVFIAAARSRETGLHQKHRAVCLVA